MQFIPLDNFKTMLKRSTNLQGSAGNYLQFYDLNGDGHNLYVQTGNYCYNNASPLFCVTSESSPWTAADRQKMFCYASSDVNISTNAYAPTTTVGSCTCQATGISDNGVGQKGWAMTITVTGSQEEPINSLYFSHGLNTGTTTSAWNEALLFALKLDTPVELNAANNYTANFTFAIEF